jgi:TPR repeat protein
MFSEAIPAIERAIALDPKNTLYWEFSAMALQQISQHDKAFAATQRGAEIGDVNAMFSLAGLHEHGRGTSVSKGKALQWLERAASAGHLSAMDVMRRVYADGLYGQAPNSTRGAVGRTLASRNESVTRATAALCESTISLKTRRPSNLREPISQAS